jgi:hypothetical protein
MCKSAIYTYDTKHSNTQPAEGMPVITDNIDLLSVETGEWRLWLTNEIS